MLDTAIVIFLAAFLFFMAIDFIFGLIRLWRKSKPTKTQTTAKSEAIPTGIAPVTPPTPAIDSPTPTTPAAKKRGRPKGSKNHKRSHQVRHISKTGKKLPTNK